MDTLLYPPRLFSPCVTLLLWVKRPGDRFQPGEPLAFLITEDTQRHLLTAQLPGVLLRCDVAAGDALNPDTPLALLRYDHRFSHHHTQPASTKPPRPRPPAPTPAPPPPTTSPPPTPTPLPPPPGPDLLRTLSPEALRLLPGRHTLIVVPISGESIREVQLGQWAAKLGDYLTPEDALVMIDTDKVSFDVRTEHHGVLIALHAEPGDTVPVGAPLATLLTFDPSPPTPPRDTSPPLRPTTRPIPPPPYIAVDLPPGQLHPLRLPTFSPSCQTGTITRWLLPVGARVNAGEVLAELEDDKAAHSLTSPHTGILAVILVPEDAEVETNTVLAHLLIPDA